MKKIITVCFSGTGFQINDPRFSAALLYNNTLEDECHIKMGFNGCGVDYGLNGLLFGTGLDKQCKEVIDRISQELSAGNEVTLNLYGHSRGGIAALLLAKQLSNIDPELLSINLAMLDPVPGNLITTSSTDPLQISLANRTMDLSECRPLKKVLALYPHIPLPSIAAHAPLLPTYPKETEVDEEVINGCHAQAEQPAHPASTLAKLRVEEFLLDNGTKFKYSLRSLADKVLMKKYYLDLYKQELLVVENKTVRKVHSARDVEIFANIGAKYFNDRHKKLAGDNSGEPVALGIQPQSGLFSQIKRFANKHPKVTTLLGWSFFALATAGLLFATGGLAALVFVPAILLASPIIKASLAFLWNIALKPAVSWCVDKYFYPFYHQMQHTPKNDNNTSLSTAKVLSRLGADNYSKTEDYSNQSSPLHSNTRLFNGQKAGPTIVPEEYMTMGLF